MQKREKECQLVNVETRLQEEGKKEEGPLKMVDSDIPPIVIQFERRQESNSPVCSDETAEPAKKLSDHEKRGLGSGLLHFTSSTVTSGEKEAAEKQKPRHEKSQSNFSLQDFLGSSDFLNEASGTTATASSSFFRTIAGTNEHDEASVMSTSFFDSSDFSPTYWAATLGENEVMAGLAVVYITLSLAHPLLFLAGALTAVGTATAVHAGYDFLVEGPICKCFCNNPSPVSSSTTASQTANGVAAEKNGTTKFNSSEKQQLQVSTGLENVVPKNEESKALSIINRQVPVKRIPTVGLNTMSTLVDCCIPDSWLELHYPTLSQVICEFQEFLGLNVKQFFEVFLADDAPYHYKEFQKKRGDKNIEYGKWRVCLDDGDASSHGPLSMHQDAKMSFPQELEYHEYLTRSTSFQAKTNNTFLGPPYASTTKEQRLLIVNKKLGVFETRTTFKDIPFCDRFYVMDRWILTADKDDNGNYKCQSRTSAEVFFVKSCPFESQIRTKTISTLQDVATAWRHMATQALLLSEQHKQERIRQEQQEDISFSNDGGDSKSLRRVKEDSERDFFHQDETNEASSCPHSIEVDLESFHDETSSRLEPTHSQPSEDAPEAKRRMFIKRQPSSLSSVTSNDGTYPPPLAKPSFSLTSRLAQMVSPARRRSTPKASQ